MRSDSAILAGGPGLGDFEPALRRRSVIGAVSAAVLVAALAGYLRAPHGVPPVPQAPASSESVASLSAEPALPGIEAPPEGRGEAAASPVAEEAPTGMARVEAPAEAPAATPPVQAAAPDAAIQAAPLARMVPLPVPRPSEFRAARPQPRMRAARAAAPAALPPQVQPDDRNFLEKLFGVDAPRAPVTAYAALESGAAEDIFRKRLAVLPPPSRATPSPGVAVYDITAKVVTLPSGERLEAHSGLGDGMDNPDRVHVRMRGSTPPGTYDLTERESLFHGVRALRMNPVGGSEAIHGRTGILAHTYMLGPSGASNGCVSFKDYDKFLQAYLRGEVQRLVVVTGRG